MTNGTISLPPSLRTPAESDTYHRGFTGLVFLYTLVLISEGALRKWILPEWSGPLLIVRDPLVLLIYAWALMHNRFQLSKWVWYGGALTLFSWGATMAQTDIPALVPIYGARIDMLHLPLMFLMATSLDRRDVEQLGRLLLWLAPVVTFIMVMQFNAAPRSWLNAGVGGSLDAQLTGALGRLRPSGPFPFTSGPSLFFPGVAAFVAYGWLSDRVYSRSLLLLASLCVVVAAPISISRTLVISIALVASATILTIARGRTGWWRFAIPLLLGPVLIFLTGTADIFLKGLATFSRRWIDASDGDVVGSTIGRFFGQFGEAWQATGDSPAFGQGLGLGSNVGAVLTTGERGFVLSEDEWARIILERGPLFGWLFLVMRIGIAVRLARAAWVGLVESNPLVPLLTATALIPVLVGQWSPPTILGFSILYGGMTLAALNPPADNDGSAG